RRPVLRARHARRTRRAGRRSSMPFRGCARPAASAPAHREAFSLSRWPALAPSARAQTAPHPPLQASLRAGAAGSGAVESPPRGAGRAFCENSALMKRALLLIFLIGCHRPESPATVAKPDDIILITIDTLRADSVG